MPNDQDHVPLPVSVTTPTEAVRATVSRPGSPNVPVLLAVWASLTVTVALSAATLGATLLTTSSKVVVLDAPSVSVAVIVTIWLWSDRQGVFSHETALALHGLSDVLPGRIHLTLPASWQSRRLRVPRGIVLAHATVPKDDRTWVGPVPVTSVVRTLLDCAAAHLAPDVLEQAVEQARERGLVAQHDIDRVLGRPGAGA